MDSSNLDATARALESSQDRFETLLVFCTLLVVVGLIMEYVGPIRDALAVRPRNRKLILTAVAGILITVGVSGELCPPPRNLDV